MSKHEARQLYLPNIDARWDVLNEALRDPRYDDIFVPARSWETRYFNWYLLGELQDDILTTEAILNIYEAAEQGEDIRALRTFVLGAIRSAHGNFLLTPERAQVLMRKFGFTDFTEEPLANLKRSDRDRRRVANRFKKTVLASRDERPHNDTAREDRERLKVLKRKASRGLTKREEDELRELEGRFGESDTD